MILVESKCVLKIFLFVLVNDSYSALSHVRRFMGYSMDELTPTKTRRAQCANWLLYYREQLFGVSLEELIARKELERNVAAENEQLRMQGESCKLLLFYFLFDVYR